MKKIVLGTMVSILLMAGNALGTGPAVVILKERAVVTGEQVKLKDVAEIVGPEAGALGSLFIIQSPAGPIGTKLSAGYIENRITSGFRAPFVMKGAPEVQIVQKYITIPKKHLDKMFTDIVYAKSPWRNKGKIIIEDINGSVGIDVPERDKNAVQAKISPREDFLGRTSITFVFGKGSTAQKVRLSAKVRVMADIPVVKETIDRNALITKADLDVKSVDISVYPSAVMDIKDCAGKRAKTRLRQGRPILKTNIEDPPLVRRGDVVFIQAKSDNLIIRDKGMALKDGHLDEQIPVRNVSSGKQVVGTIIAASCIEVHF